MKEFKAITERFTFSYSNSKGETEQFYIQEMTAAQRDKYIDTCRDRMQLNEKGEAVGMKKVSGIQTDLLALCVYRENGEAVKLDTIQNWPSSMVAELFKEAQKLNLLNQEGSEEKAAPKNV